MGAWVRRAHDEQRLRDGLRRAPIVLITGPRQAGKSTLARRVVQPLPSHLFDLEDPRDAARLGEPTLSLPALDGTIIIDEAQRRPDLFPILRVLADADPRPGRFLVLGSASPDLVGLAAESLAGRVTLLTLAGFRLGDIGADAIAALATRRNATLLPRRRRGHVGKLARRLHQHLSRAGSRQPRSARSGDDDAPFLDDARALPPSRT